MQQGATTKVWRPVLKTKNANDLFLEKIMLRNRLNLQQALKIAK